MANKGWLNLEGAGAGVPETQFFEGDSAFKFLGLTRTQRLYGFVGCLAVGFILSLLGTIMLVLGQLVIFALLYALGTVVSLIGTGFLIGFLKQLKLMFKPVRIVATIIFLGAIGLIFVGAFVIGNGVLCINFGLPTGGSLPSQPLPSTSRFDWRVKCKSRSPIVKNQSQKENDTKTTYTKRVKPTPVNLQPGDPYYDAVQAYQDRFIPLLRAEQDQEELVLKERLSTWSLARLKEEGYTLTGLSAYWQNETRFGRPVASFLLGPGLVLPEHRFANGNQILLSRIDPLQEQPVRGAVVSSTAFQLSICFQDLVDLDDADSGWRLDLGQSQYIFDLTRDAVYAFNHDVCMQEESTPSPGPYLPASREEREHILNGTYLRDVLLRSFMPSDHPHPHRPLQSPDDEAYVDQSVIDHDYHHDSLDTDTELPAPPLSDHSGIFKQNMLVHSWAKRYSKPNPVVVEGDPPLDGLNDSQRRAMAMMIGERISLIQGPPGTGKTKTIIETVKMLKIYFQIPEPLLVCTYTNVAVDNLVEGLAGAGLRPLRASSAGKVKPALQEHTLEWKMEHHPSQPELKRLVERRDVLKKELKTVREALTELQQKEHAGTASEREVKRAKRMQEDIVRKERVYGALGRRIYGLEQTMLKEILDNADVICTTCLTSASMALNLVDFPIVFLDEASMSTEPASLIPIMKGSRHVALIGDHKQLPPVIISPEARTLGLGISLFERLTEEGVVPSIMLNIQYRMHPAISHFPSCEFYNYSLKDGTVDRSGYISPRLLPPNVSSALLPPGTLSIPDSDSDIATNRPPVIFLDHTGSESLKAKSRVNWNEARIVASVVEDLLLNNDNLMGMDIGIIAPYIAQISLLTRLLNTDAKYQERFRSVLGDHRAMQLGNIEIKTVDGFEGREKEVIIFSTVRNNVGGYIGFLADRRRLNVGLTRAKRGLFVIGSVSTLKLGKLGGEESSTGGKGKGADSWKRFIQYLTENGLVLNLAGETLAKVLYGNVNAVTGVNPTRSQSGRLLLP
uniref:P-loop containing nucleoside triphosphate hydrolase protein n=1 Tax=Moniliophthora roreri TaxID=221103 RepID=A0A0W0FZN0_MONRR